MENDGKSGEPGDTGTSTFVRTVAFESGLAVEVAQHHTGDEGVVVWDAALVMAYFLEKHKKSYRLGEGIQAIELGAGTGVVGLVAAALGASCIVTDLEHLLPLIRQSVHLNQEVLQKSKGRIEAKALRWGDQDFLRTYQNEPTIDLILLADCIYYEESIEPLVETIIALSSKPGCKVLLSYEDRDDYEDKKMAKEKFFNLVRNHFEVKYFTTDDCHPEFASDDIHVVELTKKLKL